NSDDLPRKPAFGNLNQSSSSVSASAKDDEEESIEQYMAKLLQRVRGDAEPSTTFIPARSVPLNAPTSEAAETESELLPAVVVLYEEPQPVTREAVKRKPLAQETAADLGALRALANETARRAISQSELRKHRRNAVTKVIVSTLAGVTSLWLM